MAEARPRTVDVHGHPISFIEAGSGPVLLLIHGMAGTCVNWEAVIEPLAIHHTVIAPDFPGHGASAPGGGDYALGSLASGLRDLMLALGHELGPDVSPILRAAALPGAELFISATAGVGSRVGSVVGRGLGLVGLRPNADLAETLPLLIVWGEKDPIIPVAHAHEAHAQLPGSRLEIFEDAGHVPQLERPGRFIAVLERFIAETDPAEFDRDEWRARFKAAES